MAANPWISVMTDRIVNRFRPLRVILFGSQARKDTGAPSSLFGRRRQSLASPLRGGIASGSDIDLLVVLPQVSDRRQAAIEIRRALSDIPAAKDIIVTTPDEIARRGNLLGTVLRAALREGRVLYERG